MKYLRKFANHTAYLTAENTLDKPNVSLCVQLNEVHYNSRTWTDEYLTTVARENGTISFNIWKSMGTDLITSISYSTDNGETWTTTANQNNKSANLVIDVNVNNGDKILWKGIATQMGFLDDEELLYVGSFFSSTCEFDVQGNIMSLLYGDNFKGQTDLTGKDYTFYQLFYQNTKVVNAKNLSLPATTLAEGCYAIMFNGCTSLTTAPELPALSLVSNCYASMFEGCINLTTAPELSATTLANDCYNSMFYDCTRLNYIKAMFTTTPGNNTANWVFGVSATGTFVKNVAAEWNVTGVSGIPSGWTIKTASEQPIPVRGKAQVFANPLCTKYTDGQSETVWVRLNVDVGFGESMLWSTNLSVGSPTSLLPNDCYMVMWEVDWVSADHSGPFSAGEIIECTYNPAAGEFIPIDQPLVIFE